MWIYQMRNRETCGSTGEGLQLQALYFFFGTEVFKAEGSGFELQKSNLSLKEYVTSRQPNPEPVFQTYL